jgi:aminoglycoside phosphotransferase (APT) family kinase protein
MGDDLDGAVLELLAAAGHVGSTATVSRSRRLTGGASRQTHEVDVSDGDRTLELIVQRTRPGSSGSGLGAPTEAALLAAAADQGVPVPAVLAVDDGGRPGAATLVVERLTGETIARRILRDDEWAEARTRLAEQAGAALAGIHRMPGDVAPLRSDDQLQQLVALMDGFGEPFPAFELAVRWLAANRPPSAGETVVHGDFRLGNLLVDADGLRGVLDWELAHLGDPVEDLGWFCVRAWRFGSPLPAGGVGTREQLLEGYQEAGGRAVDRDALRWWEVLGTVKWGLICRMQAEAHLSGAVRSVELATIGRRVCENEWDVLGLLPGDPLPGPVTGADRPGAGLHGRPTALELVEAVRGFLEADVRDALEGRVSFNARVAANALAIVERELAQDADTARDHLAAISALGVADDASLARRIRAGDLDDRIEEVRSAIAPAVRARLEVANPRWLDGP